MFSVAALALLCLASFDAVTPLPQATRELSATLAAGRRVLEIADREARVRDPEGQPPVPSSRPTFALEDVTAHYPAGDRLVLHGVSLTLAPGRKVALVGPSGSGKTTVANLLLRSLDPADGRVTLDRRDLRDYRQADVRNAIALAGQDSHLFATSIRENVRIGNPAATDAELRTRCGAPASRSGLRRCRTVWTRWSARRAPGSPAASDSASASLARSWRTLRSSSSTSRPPISTR